MAAGGRSTAIADSGTTNQQAYATAAPNVLRSGRRSSRTNATAPLVATVVSNNACSHSATVIVDLLEQLAQFGDVLAAELAMLAEVRDQRRDTTIEQAFQQALAFAEHPGLALEHRCIQVTPAVLAGADGALFQQAIEQGLDRRFLPLPAVGQCGNDILGRQRLALPEHLHDGRLGFADLHRLHL